MMACDVVPVLVLKFNPPGNGPTVRAGAAKTLSTTPTVCGLPVMAIPLLSTAASEMVSLNDPTPRDAESTLTVKGVLPPVMTAEVGEIDSQLCVTVGVIVIFPEQAPKMPMVKLWVSGLGLSPTSLPKFTVGTEAACSVHGGCTVRVTVMVCGVPTF